MKCIRFISVLTVSVTGLVSAATVTAEPPDRDGAVEQEEIVVWAERRTGTAGAPSATVTAADADATVAKDIGELLQFSVPGVTGQRSGAAQVDPVLRGVRAERVNVAIDGAQVHGACPSRMDPETSLLDIAEVAEVEVIKGPYALTRGPVGVGGTIDVRTTEPELSPTLVAHGSATAAYTSNADGWTTQGAASVADSRAAFRLSGGWRDFGDYSSGSGERIPSSFLNRNLAGALLWQPTADDGVRVNASIHSARDVHFASSSMDTAEEDTVGATLGYTRKSPLPAIETVSASSYYRYVDHLMNNADKPSSAMMPMSAPLTAATVGGGVRGTLAAIGQATLTLGGDAYRVDYDGDREMTQVMRTMARMSMPPRVLPHAVWPDAHLVDGGVFVETAYAIAPRWRTVFGARLDVVDAGAHPDQAARDAFVRYNGSGGDDTSAFETNLSANARLIYAPLDRVDVFLGLGRGVRTAAATERFYVFGPGRGGYLVGNPSLNPEDNLETDIGTTVQWQRFRLDGTFFYNRVERYIAPVVLEQEDVDMDGNVDVVRGFRNIDVATLLGVDGEASYALTDRLRLFGTVAYVYGQDEERHEPLPEVPPLEGTVGVQVQRSWADKWSGWIMPRLRMVARQDRIARDAGEDASAGFATVDCLSGVRFGDRYALHLAVRNLLDVNYHEHLTRENPFTGAEVPEPGRMVSVAFRVAL